MFVAGVSPVCPVNLRLLQVSNEELPIIIGLIGSKFSKPKRGGVILPLFKNIDILFHLIFEMIIVFKCKSRCIEAIEMERIYNSIFNIKFNRFVFDHTEIQSVVKTFDED